MLLLHLECHVTVVWFHRWQLKPWSHDTSKSTLKSRLNFTNKNKEKEIKTKWKWGHLYCFMKALNCLCRLIPPRKDSWLTTCSPWKNKGERISKHQPSRNQGGRSGKQQPAVRPWPQTSSGEPPTPSQKWGEEKCKGAEAGMCKSITGRSFSGHVHELLKWTERESVQSWRRSEVKKNNTLPRKGNRRREGRG